MSFRDFTFPQVQHDLGLTVHDANLFAAVPNSPVRNEFAAFLRDGIDLAVANATEKAKSEFIIAPVLLELRRAVGPRFALFSGQEWNAAPDRGLNGYCDFLLTKSTSQYILGAPFVAVVEAKNDLIPTGLGQCIAAMFAAQLVNQKSGTPIAAVHGVVSTGTAWKFLRLQGSNLTIDVPEYLIDNLPKIMGILKHIVESV
jgi:hypothetical protein